MKKTAQTILVTGAGVALGALTAMILADSKPVRAAKSKVS